MPQTTTRTARCRVVISDGKGTSIPYSLVRSGSGWLWIKNRRTRYHVVEDTSGRFCCTCKGWFYNHKCKHADFIKMMFSDSDLLELAHKALIEGNDLIKRQQQRIEEMERIAEEQAKQLAIFTPVVPAPKKVRSRSKKAKQS